MPTLEDAVEGSTYILLLSFRNESDVVIVPNDAKWSMYDNTGAVVNARQDVALTPATVMSIVLSGDDLLYEKNSMSMRAVTVTGTYDGVYGTGLPIAEEFTFSIRPLVGIPDGP